MALRAEKQGRTHKARPLPSEDERLTLKAVYRMGWVETLKHGVTTRRISPSHEQTTMSGLCFASSQAPSLYPAIRVIKSHGLSSVSPVSALLRRIPARLPLLGQLINYLAARENWLK